MNRLIATAVTAAAFALSAGPAAADLAWSIDAGASRTDNATRVATDKVDDTLLTLGAGITFAHESRRVQAALSGSGSFLDYVDNSYDSEFLSSGNGSLVFGIVPERFLWTFDDTFGQNTVNQLQAATPDNRQNVNLFSTGPDLLLRLGTQSSLRISGRYGDSRYGRTDTVDDQRLSGSVALTRNTSPKVAWSLVGEASRVEYDIAGNPGYDQQSLYAQLQAEGARQTVELGVGANRVADNGETYTNPLVRLNWTRKVTPSLTLAVNLGSEYRNTGDRFRAGLLASDGGTVAVRASGIPSETYYGGASLAFTRPRTGFYVGAGYSRDNYVQSTQPDEKSWSLSAGVSRRFTQRLQGFLDANYQKRDFGAGIGQDKTTTANAKLDWAFGRATYLTGGYRYQDRSSGIGVFGYSENVFYLSISYRYGSSTGPRNLLY